MILLFGCSLRYYIFLEASDVYLLVTLEINDVKAGLRQVFNVSASSASGTT